MEIISAAEICMYLHKGCCAQDVVAILAVAPGASITLNIVLKLQILHVNLKSHAMFCEGYFMNVS